MRELEKVVISEDGNWLIFLCVITIKDMLLYDMLIVGECVLFVL